MKRDASSARESRDRLIALQRILVTILLLVTGQAYGEMALHHYSFDSTTVVDSVGTANGTLIGGATVNSGMLTLDGVDDSVQFGQQIIPTTGDFSVMFLARELSPSSWYAEIISQGRTGGAGFYVGYGPTHNVRIGDSWMNTGIAFPSDGLFHHYAVTRSDTDTRFYIDRSLVAINPWPIQMSGFGDVTRLGRQFSPYGEYFHGNIDELWVFRGALTPDQIVVPLPGAVLLGALGLSVAGWRLKREVG